MLGESRTRGHSLRISSKPFRTEKRKHFFSQRVTYSCNYCLLSIGSTGLVFTGIDWKDERDLTETCKILEGFDRLEAGSPCWGSPEPGVTVLE